MSNDIVVQKKYQTDMTTSHEQVMDEYIASGLPGIGRVTEADVFQWFNLYLAGRSYGDIASQCKTQLCLVLYVANKHQWYEKKTKHYENLMEKVNDKLSTIKGESVSFLVDMMTFTHRFYGQDVSEYLKTNDKEAAKNIDFKNFDRYFKIVDALEKMLQNPERLVRDVKDAKNSPAVSVNVNVGDAITSTGEDGSVLIESNPLKQILELKRKEEQNKK